MAMPFLSPLRTERCGRLTAWKEERRRVHTDGQGDRRTDRRWLPVGQGPWAPCLGEGSFSALILPCWGGLVVVWDPWNWAAVAVSQELLLEAGFPF